MMRKSKLKLMRRRVVCVDFDGVIYKNMNYKGTAILNELPVDGAIDALKELAKSNEVVINSARCESDAGMKAVQEWLNKHELPYRLSKYKPHADVYIDDRAVCFSGDWDETLNDVDGFKQWQAADKQLNRLKKKGSVCQRIK